MGSGVGSGVGVGWRVGRGVAVGAGVGVGVRVGVGPAVGGGVAVGGAAVAVGVLVGVGGAVGADVGGVVGAVVGPLVGSPLGAGAAAVPPGSPVAPVDASGAALPPTAATSLALGDGPLESDGDPAGVAGELGSPAPDGPAVAVAVTDGRAVIGPTDGSRSRPPSTTVTTTASRTQARTANTAGRRSGNRRPLGRATRRRGPCVNLTRVAAGEPRRPVRSCAGACVRDDVRLQWRESERLCQLCAIAHAQETMA